MYVPESGRHTDRYVNKQWERSSSPGNKRLDSAVVISVKMSPVALCLGGCAQRPGRGFPAQQTCIGRQLLLSAACSDAGLSTCADLGPVLGVKVQLTLDAVCLASSRCPQTPSSWIWVILENFRTQGHFFDAPTLYGGISALNNSGLLFSTQAWVNHGREPRSILLCYCHMACVTISPAPCHSSTQTRGPAAAARLCRWQ